MTVASLLPRRAYTRVINSTHQYLRQTISDQARQNYSEAASVVIHQRLLDHDPSKTAYILPSSVSETLPAM